MYVHVDVYCKHAYRLMTSYIKETAQGESFVTFPVVGTVPTKPPDFPKVMQSFCYINYIILSLSTKYEYDYYIVFHPSFIFTWKNGTTIGKGLLDYHRE